MVARLLLLLCLLSAIPDLAAEIHTGDPALASITVPFLTTRERRPGTDLDGLAKQSPVCCKDG